MMLITVWIISLFLTSAVGQRSGQSFATFINEFSDKVGFQAMQNIYNAQQFTNYKINGETLVAEMTGSLFAKFNGPIQAARKLKEKVEAEESNFPGIARMDECCRAMNVVENTKFRSKVNLGDTCIRKAGGISTNSTFPNDAVKDIMKQNLWKYPNLKWQYFASEEGYFMSYPSSLQAGSCTDYDPRFRPFYVETATPVPKDVVVIIDRSGSMGNTAPTGQKLIDIAKDAAITVLDTLNPNDRVSIVSFSDVAEIVGTSSRSCLKSQLAMATPLNKNYLRERIRRLTPMGATNYAAALQKAFELFISSNHLYNDSTREKAILFLTDGKMTVPGDPLMTVSTNNRELGNRVMIFTYALGNSFTSNDIQLLQNIAAQTKTDTSYGDIQRGEYHHITDPSRLRSAMASYYNRFSSDEKLNSPVFSVPYVDALGLGLVTTVCLPVYRSSGVLYGVSCVDITMSDLMSDITYFQQGEISYAFIIDGTGRTLMHPQLPLPSSVLDDPIFLHLEHLERESSAEEVIQNMMTGISGEKNFMSKRSFPRGEILKEGIETRLINSTYYWAPVEQTNFSLCIVVGYGDTQSTFTADPTPSTSFTYHRIDIQEKSPTQCRHFSRYCNKGYSTVMLTPGAFKDPFKYLDDDEALANSLEYKRYLTGERVPNPGIKESVISSVSVTFEIEDIWKKNTDADELVVWRYVGTKDGIIRLYPGVQLPKNYDHTRRPWYLRSLAFKGKFVFSAPYQDQWGSGLLITLSKTVLEKSSQAQPVLGVVGTDFRIPYLYQALVNTYSICKDTSHSCFLLDSSGFVVVHKDFVEPENKDQQVENVHIIFKEPSIAEDMIIAGYMAKHSCLDFENIKEQSSYRVFISLSTASRKGSGFEYEIHQVVNSNVFVVIKKHTAGSSSRCCSQNVAGAPDATVCTNVACDCLCYKNIDFQYCRNRYPLLSDAPQTCTPRTPKLAVDDVWTPSNINDYYDCFSPNCKGKSSKGKCYESAGCNWCRLTTKRELLSSPFCGSIYDCDFTGMVSKDIAIPPTDSGDEGGTPVAAIVVPIVLLVVIAVVISTTVYRRRFRQKGAQCERNRETPTSRTTASTSSSTSGTHYNNSVFVLAEPSAPPSNGHDAPPSYHQAMGRSGR